MITILLFLVAGFAGGLLLGLVGVGIALVIVPFLTFILPGMGVPQDASPLIAVATCMAIVAVGSVSSVVSHTRLGNVNWAIVRTTIPGSVIGVLLGSMAVGFISGRVLQVLFAAFILYTSFNMLKGAGRQAAAPATEAGRALYPLVGGLIGFAGSFIGAGGGIFMVPFLKSRGHAMASAVATSTTIGLPVSIIGAIVYAATKAPFQLHGMMGLIFLPAFIGLSIGSVLGAPLGAKLASIVPAAALRRAFGLLLLVIGARMLLPMVLS